MYCSIILFVQVSKKSFLRVSAKEVRGQNLKLGKSDGRGLQNAVKNFNLIKIALISIKSCWLLKKLWLVLSCIFVCDQICDIFTTNFVTLLLLLKYDVDV
jgi:hypothetical protein